MKTEVLTEEITVRPHYKGAQKSKEKHQLKWGLDLQAYLVPQVRGKRFYPRHRLNPTITVVASGEEERVGVNLLSLGSDDETIHAEGSQIVVDGPGLLTLKMGGDTRNFYGKGVSDIERKDYRANHSAEYKVAFEPARDGAERFSLSNEELAPDAVVASEEVMYRWSSS